MTDRNRQVLNELLQKEENKLCADCKCEGQNEWASCNLGAFLCQECASIHRSLGVDISRIKSVRLDNWEDDQVKKMAEVGNDIVNAKYEQHLPTYYKRPTKADVEVLRQQFIRAKYERKEFMYPDKQVQYSRGKKEGVLMKRGKKDKSFRPRRFIISSQDNSMKYYNKDQAKEPKDLISLDDINAAFVPEKLGNPNGLQITYMKNGITRNLFVYCDNSQEIVDWYTCIRAAKLERRKIAFPNRDEAEISKDLTTDFLCEGMLKKKGPKQEPYRERWFTLDRRKFMYFPDVLAANPKGEVFIGHRDAKYSVTNADDAQGNIKAGCQFILETPGRKFELAADSYEDMERWITALQKVIDTPPTPQDLKICNNMVKRK